MEAHAQGVIILLHVLVHGTLFQHDPLFLPPFVLSSPAAASGSTRLPLPMAFKKVMESRPAEGPAELRLREDRM
jgi:hypothetical protein